MMVSSDLAETLLYPGYIYRGGAHINSPRGEFGSDRPLSVSLVGIGIYTVQFREGGDTYRGRTRSISPPYDFSSDGPLSASLVVMGKTLYNLGRAVLSTGGVPASFPHETSLVQMNPSRFPWL